MAARRVLTPCEGRYGASEGRQQPACEESADEDAKELALSAVDRIVNGEHVAIQRSSVEHEMNEGRVLRTPARSEGGLDALAGVRIFSVRDIHNKRKEVRHGVSDQLSKLAARAKDAEDHAAAAKSKAKAELEQDFKTARESAKAQADQLSKAAEANKGKLSAWWDSLQRSWHEHIAEMRQNIDEKRDTHDLAAAQREADSAEDDAAFAIDYAYAAIEEAEYAVLDATLARMNADGLAAGAGAASS
jgi:hypothetical protein